MTHQIQVIKHEVVPLCGSYEVRFPDGRPSRFFYFDDMAGRQLRPDLADKKTAQQAAEFLAAAEQDLLDSQSSGK
jgi:hypothetical protein